jgi:predicted methyltransferase
MKLSGLIGAPALLALALTCGAAAYAQQPPPADALSDPTMKGKEVIAFIGVKPGDKVADIVAGRFVRAFIQAIGPNGKLYAVEPAEVVKVHPEVVAVLKPATSAPNSNVILSTDPIDATALPIGLDAVFIRQNYHDLHDKFMGPADVAKFNKAMFAALKPGGVYVVLDHADAAGSGLKSTDTLHRIDPATVKSEIEAAGFKFDSESTILANPADDHTKNVFDPSIRGKTDQFLYKFRKPG